MAAVCGKFENSNELCSRRFPFKLVSVLSSRYTLPFLLYSHADYISFPFKLANYFLKPANRPAHSSIIRHGSDESVVFPRKIERFLAVSVSFFRPRGVRVFYAETINGARDAFVFLLSSFLFPPHPPFIFFF